MKMREETNEIKRLNAEHEIITEINELGQFARIDKYNRAVSTWSRFVRRYDIFNSWPNIMEWLKANYCLQYEAYQPMQDISSVRFGVEYTPFCHPDIKIIVNKKGISK